MSTRHLKPLPIPAFFDGKRAAEYAYRPDAAMLASTATDWRAQHAIKPAAADETRVHLLLIAVADEVHHPQQQQQHDDQHDPARAAAPRRRGILVGPQR